MLEQVGMATSVSMGTLMFANDIKNFSEGFLSIMEVLSRISHFTWQRAKCQYQEKMYIYL